MAAEGRILGLADDHLHAWHDSVIARAADFQAWWDYRGDLPIGVAGE